MDTQEQTSAAQESARTVRIFLISSGCSGYSCWLARLLDRLRPFDYELADLPQGNKEFDTIADSHTVLTDEGKPPSECLVGSLAQIRSKGGTLSDQCCCRCSRVTRRREKQGFSQGVFLMKSEKRRCSQSAALAAEGRRMFSTRLLGSSTICGHA